MHILIVREAELIYEPNLKSLLINVHYDEEEEIKIPDSYRYCEGINW